MNNKKILIIAFKFPPMGGVGSRRWAKFSKFLALRGYEIDVITTEYPYVDKVNWNHDVNHPNITIHRIKAGIPLIILKESKNRFEKIISFLFNKLFKSLFYYLDNAQCWHKTLIPYARTLIREKNIINVIVTGPPSSLHYSASFLKIENPLINLIQDFRDSWNDDINYEYKTTLKHFYQKECSVRMEDFVFAHADKIIFVTKDIEKRYSNIYSALQNKFSVVHNGFDRDDSQGNLASNKNIKQSFSIIYAGTLGLGRKKAISLLAKAIDILKDDFFSNFRIVIYSEIKLSDFVDHPLYSSIKQYFIFHDFIDSRKLSEVISSHRYGLSINSEMYPYAFGTKVFDYMGAGKKILHISNGGELYDYLKAKGSFTASYCVEEIASELRKMKNDFSKTEVTGIEYPEFDLENLTTIFESLFSI